MATSSSFTSASYSFTLYKTTLDDLVDHFEREARGGGVMEKRIVKLFESFKERGQRFALIACVDSYLSVVHMPTFLSSNNEEDAKLSIIFGFSANGSYDYMIEILEEQAERPLTPSEKTFIRESLLSFRAC